MKGNQGMNAKLPLPLMDADLGYFACTSMLLWPCGTIHTYHMTLQDEGQQGYAMQDSQSVVLPELPQYVMS